MIKKITSILAIVVCLSAASEKENFLAFEKILNGLEADKSKLLPPLTESQDQKINIGIEYDFVATGAYSIDGEWIAYLLTNKNHLLKAKKGLQIGSKKIVDINSYGITIADSSDKTFFMPIMEQKIEESDISFFNKKEKKDKSK
ncbi:MAG: hypothetical protein QG567_2179 [Campylobacterota bacterium]|nr:hypothetical protein [Campylobacterota bacterium]